MDIVDSIDSRLLRHPFWLTLGRSRTRLLERIGPHPPDASVQDAPLEFRHRGVPMGVVSNSSFGQRIIRHELAKHGLSDGLAVIAVSAEYAVRKPNPLLFEAAAGLLGVPPAHVWFIGDQLHTDVVGARAARMTPFLYVPQPAAEYVDRDVIAATWPGLVRHFREARA